MTFARWPRTDVGTVLLHWIAVGAIGVLLWTGLRLTADDVHQQWLRDYDGWLAGENLWGRHMLAGYVLSMVVAGYGVYVTRARLGERIRLNLARLQGLFGSVKTRWSAINVLLYWVFILATLGACVTGWMAYHGLGGAVLKVHLWCSWAVLAFPVLHLAALLRLGGIPHIARILRPKRIEPGGEEIDFAEIVAELLAEKRAAAARAAQRRAQPGQPS
ncbi:MAG: cytochrome b/b6 domain-containing protein [Maritimibacter sp.]|nr:cytochrome b/b6 domain-containing protein [Maritimibacter sp.]